MIRRGVVCEIVRLLVRAWACAAVSACALFPSLDNLDGDASVDASGDTSAADTHTDVTTKTDAAADVVHMDVALPPPPPDGAPYVYCGAKYCAVGTEVCCESLTTGPGGCAPADAGCPDADLTVPCSNPADCTALGFPNTFCCATELPTDQAQAVSCLATCVDLSGTSTRLCDPLSDASTCTAGTSCQVSTSTVPDLYICK